MIQPTSQLSGFYRTDAITSSASHKAPAIKVPPESGDRLSSANTDALREALVNTSEVRPHVVKRGRELAVDPNYPPREIIERLSKLMVESRDFPDNA
jgi:hypothetical protein